MDNLEMLNTKIQKQDNMIKQVVRAFDQNNTGYKQNFDIIRNHFSKIEHMMKMQDNVVDQQESTIRTIEEQIQEIMRVINNEVLYYKDRRERPPNPDMYSGGFKSKKSRKTRKRRKTSKRK
jgi:hypothetical protein